MTCISGFLKYFNWLSKGCPEDFEKLIYLKFNTKSMVSVD